MSIYGHRLYLRKRIWRSQISDKLRSNLELGSGIYTSLAQGFIRAWLRDLYELGSGIYMSLAQGLSSISFDLQKSVVLS